MVQVRPPWLGKNRCEILGQPANQRIQGSAISQVRYCGCQLRAGYFPSAFFERIFDNRSRTLDHISDALASGSTFCLGQRRRFHLSASWIQRDDVQRKVVVASCRLFRGMNPSLRPTRVSSSTDPQGVLFEVVVQVRSGRYPRQWEVSRHSCSER